MGTIKQYIFRLGMIVMWFILWFLGVPSFFVLLWIWSSALRHGFWPYSEKFTEAEKWETEEAEAKAVINTVYLLCAITIPSSVGVTLWPRHVFDKQKILYGLLIDAAALLISVYFHISMRISSWNQAWKLNDLWTPF